VSANIAPAAVQEMCHATFVDYIDRAVALSDRAIALRNKLQPLFDVVTVSANRTTASGDIVDKFRNPLAIKLMMNVLGMPAGPCRQPLGKMSWDGLQKVRNALTTVWTESPEILKPIEGFFNVNIGKRLADEELWQSLSY